MHLEFGPLEAASARSWIDNARTVLSGIRGAGDRLPIEIPPDVSAAFETFVDEWDAIARSGDVFHWSADVDPELVRHLAVYWFSLMTVDDDMWTAMGLPFAPPESTPFYEALASAVTEALAAVDNEVGTAIKASWPEETSIPPRPARPVPVRVVVVDDVEDVRLLLTLHLKLDGRFDVVGEATNGRDAIEVCRALQPDAVLLDISMPGMDGLTALPLIREASPASRVVMLSADDRRDNVERARVAGAHAFVTKASNLDAAVNALLS